MFEDKHKKLYKLIQSIGFITGLGLFFIILYGIITSGLHFIIKNYILIGVVVIVFIVFSLLNIRVLTSFFDGFKRFTKIINYVVNFVLLSVAYVIGIGIISVPSKIVKKHFLNTNKNSADTYYINKKLGEESLERYYNQF